VSPRVRIALAAAMVAALAPPAAAEDVGFELRVADHVEVAAGAAGTVSLTVVPTAGRSVSGDGPLRIELSAGDGLTLPRRRYERRDAADPAAEAPRFELRFRGAAPGRHPLRIAVRFWLCREKTCRPAGAERTVTVEVR